jgi:NAD+ synthase (glutamine-hydrolysing)
MAPHFKDRKHDTTEENVQARIRGNILMALSNKFGFLTLSTGNKSELSVGYCTLYGDMSGGLSVIADVPKTLVYRLSEHRNTIKKVIPERILRKPPSAELKENQRDQDTLPPYEILDRILHLTMDLGKPREEILAEGLDETTVDWIITAVFDNEYKRRQAAPGLKVTAKAFGSGRRMPIAAKHQI